MGSCRSMVFVPLCVCAVIALVSPRRVAAQDDPAAARQLERALRKAEAASPRIERRLRGGEFDYYLFAVFAKERRKPRGEPAAKARPDADEPAPAGGKARPAEPMAAGDKPRTVVTVVLAIIWSRKGAAETIAGSLYVPPGLRLNVDEAEDDVEAADYYSLLAESAIETPTNIDYQVIDSFRTKDFRLAWDFREEFSKALSRMPPAKAAGDKGGVKSITVGHRTVDGKQQWEAILQHAKGSPETAPAPFKESLRLVIPAAYADFDELAPAFYSSLSDEDLADFGSEGFVPP